MLEEIDWDDLLEEVDSYPPFKGLLEVCPLEDCGCSGEAHA